MQVLGNTKHTLTLSPNSNRRCIIGPVDNSIFAPHLWSASLIKGTPKPGRAEVVPSIKRSHNVKHQPRQDTRNSWPVGSQVMVTVWRRVMLDVCPRRSCAAWGGFLAFMLGTGIAPRGGALSISRVPA